jgi:hypothetical protein
MHENDASARVRFERVALMFAAVHRPEVAESLAARRDCHPCANVRKQAGLRAPGGVLYRLTSPVQAERRAARKRKHLKAQMVRT